MNPRAAINDLLPFQGSPFGQLGYFSKLPYLLSKFFIKLFLLSCDSLFSITDVPLFVKHFLNLFFKVFNKRREWDSNPRALADKRFSRPPRYDHFDISPYIIIKQKKRFAHQELSFTQEVVSVSAKRILSLKPFCVNKIFYFFQKFIQYLKKASAIARSSGVVILIFW